MNILCVTNQNYYSQSSDHSSRIFKYACDIYIYIFTQTYNHQQEIYLIAINNSIWKSRASVIKVNIASDGIITHTFY